MKFNAFKSKIKPKNDQHHDDDDNDHYYNDKTDD